MTYLKPEQKIVQDLINKLSVQLNENKNLLQSQLSATESMLAFLASVDVLILSTEQVAQLIKLNGDYRRD